VFDPKSDSVWPADYGVSCYEQIDEAFKSAATIGSAGGTIGSLGGTIGSFKVGSSLEALAQGTFRGFVNVYDPNLSTRAGNRVDWEYTTHYVSGQDPSKERELRRIYVERERVSDVNDATIITVSVRVDNATGMVDILGSNKGVGISLDYADFCMLSHVHQIALTGKSPTLIRVIGVMGLEQEQEFKNG